MAKKHSTHLIDHEDLQKTSDYGTSRTKYTRIKRKVKTHTIDETTKEEQEVLIEEVNKKLNKLIIVKKKKQIFLF